MQGSRGGEVKKKKGKIQQFQTRTVATEKVKRYRRSKAPKTFMVRDTIDSAKRRTSRPALASPSERSPLPSRSSRPRNSSRRSSRRRRCVRANATLRRGAIRAHPRSERRSICRHARPERRPTSWTLPSRPTHARAPEQVLVCSRWEGAERAVGAPIRSERERTKLPDEVGVAAFSGALTSDLGGFSRNAARARGARVGLWRGERRGGGSGTGRGRAAPRALGVPLLLRPPPPPPPSPLAPSFRLSLHSCASRSSCALPHARVPPRPRGAVVYFALRPSFETRLAFFRRP